MSVGLFIGVLLTSFLTALAVTGAVRKIGVWRGLVDVPSLGRKIHRHPVPSLGGIAIYLGFMVPVLGVTLSHLHGSSESLLDGGEVAALAIGCGLVMVVGVLDDVRGLSYRRKLGYQASAALLLVVTGWEISAVTLPFAESVPLGFLSVPLTMFWLMGSTNAFNLIDGLDGLASGVGVIALASMAGVAVILQNEPASLLAVALLGSILGFLIFNSYPASIFLGDSGSMLLGFAVGAIALESARSMASSVVIYVPIVVLALPITDTAVAIVRRWLSSAPITEADREHIHHRLLDLGARHRDAVLILYGVAVFFGVVGLLMVQAESWVVVVALAALAGLVLLALRTIYGLRLSLFIGRFRQLFGHH